MPMFKGRDAADSQRPGRALPAARRVPGTLLSFVFRSRVRRGARAPAAEVMSIDWNAFTPWSAAIGGVIIGLAVAICALANGRIAGISGVVGGLLRPARGDIAWRVAFVAGLIAAPLL